MALRKVAAQLVAPRLRLQAPRIIIMASGSRTFSDRRSLFDDKEEAYEAQYIRQHDKKQMELLLERMQEAQQNQDEAKEALAKILGPGIPEDVLKELFAWKDKFARTRLGVTGLER